MKSLRDFYVHEIQSTVEQINSNLCSKDPFEKNEHPERVFERAKEHYVKYLKRRIEMCELIDFKQFNEWMKRMRLR